MEEVLLLGLKVILYSIALTELASLFGGRDVMAVVQRLPQRALNAGQRVLKAGHELA
jgi:hypothetical protein